MIREAHIDDISVISNLWFQMSKLHEEYDATFQLKENAVDVFKEYAKSVIMSEDKMSIVYCNEEVVGYLFAEIYELPPVYINEKAGLISEISIDQKYRRKGFGEKLIKHAENWFAEQEIKIIECQVAIRNPLSSNFWTKMGYIEHSLMSRKIL